MLKLTGMPGSYGIAIGKAVLGEDLRPSAQAEVSLPFEEALRLARDDLIRLRNEVAAHAPHEAEIFSAQLLMLDDPMLQGGIRRRIAQGEPVEKAISGAIAELTRLFRELKDPLLRERQTDLEDIGRRLSGRLRKPPLSACPPEQGILVARELFPSDIAGMNPEQYAGFATDLGTPTSHAAILARSLGFPGVFGLKDITRYLRPGDILIIDGTAGAVYLDPDRETLRRYASRTEDTARLPILRGPVMTAHGVLILVKANIGSAGGSRQALEMGADGIGVVRTEFLFQDRERLPDEEEQLAAYRQIAEGMEGRPVIIRTLDAGSDKPLPCLPLEPEANPALGWRGIRLSLEMPDTFLPQVRAILRASAFGPVGVMFPMIATLEEFLKAREMAESALQELRRQGRDIPPVPIGTMIEIPSSALIADALAREADFLSIGTNDLIQYAFAADRANPKVASLTDPRHEAVLRLIGMVSEAGRAHGKPVSVCGEMAADPESVPFLLRLGITELSVSPVFIPALKRQISKLDLV
ncbi:MAG: phosphoenolpyruvate--protein phosphotransferase [Armatimonadetes bacterium]|nr:phosphoenolpyruvate--protein phosphotransferase [Armatimonadota bacterium]